MSGSREPLSRQPVNGLLLVDKPAGCTSHDIVGVIRRAARTKRVGHAGTLDPFATGLLVVAIGACTRLLPYLNSEPKVYDATIQFGVETNTDDSTGIEVRAAPLPDMHALPLAVQSLTGNLAQIPPAFSAKHVDGQRAYVMARRGDVVTLPPVNVIVHEWIVGAVTADRLDARIVCGGGTYVRALARDLGRELASAAHCAALRRVASGTAHLRDAVAYSTLTPGAIADGAIVLHAPLMYLEPMTHVALDAPGMTALSHGRTIPARDTGDRAALLRDGDVVAIAERVAGDLWQPRVVLLGADA